MKTGSGFDRSFLRKWGSCANSFDPEKQIVPVYTEVTNILFTEHFQRRFFSVHRRRFTIYIKL